MSPHLSIVISSAVGHPTPLHSSAVSSVSTCFFHTPVASLAVLILVSLTCFHLTGMFQMTYASGDCLLKFNACKTRTQSQPAATMFLSHALITSGNHYFDPQLSLLLLPLNSCSHICPQPQAPKTKP